MTDTDCYLRLRFINFFSLKRGEIVEDIRSKWMDQRLEKLDGKERRGVRVKVEQQYCVEQWVLFCPFRFEQCLY